MRRAQVGITLLEFAIVVLIVAILIAAATPRVFEVRAEVERIALERRQAELRALLTLELAELLKHGGWEASNRLAGRNPAELWPRAFGEPMPGYIGEAAVDATVAPGSWFYDPERELLVYRVRWQDRFDSDGPWPDRVRFTMVLQGEQKGGQTRVTGVRLEPVDAYRWNVK